MDEVARLGGLDLVDGLGVHPYDAREPDDPAAWMMRLEALNRRLAELGKPERRIVLPVRNGAFFARLKWSGPIPGTVEARYPGSGGYVPAFARTWGAPPGGLGRLRSRA